jgi:hypothetical protein
MLVPVLVCIGEKVQRRAPADVDAVDIAAVLHDQLHARCRRRPQHRIVQWPPPKPVHGRCCRRRLRLGLRQRRRRASGQRAEC